MFPGSVETGGTVSTAGPVTVLSSADKWYGVTYKEDKEKVVDAIRTMTEQGQYPSPLWQ